MKINLIVALFSKDNVQDFVKDWHFRNLKNFFILCVYEICLRDLWDSNEHARTHRRTFFSLWTQSNVLCPLRQQSSSEQAACVVFTLYWTLACPLARPTTHQPRLLLALESSVGFSWLLSIHLPVKRQGSPTVKHTMVVEEQEELGARERQQQHPTPQPLSPPFFFNKALSVCACCASGLLHCLLERHRGLLGNKIVLPLKQLRGGGWGGGPWKRCLPTAGLPVGGNLAWKSSRAEQNLA